MADLWKPVQVLFNDRRFVGLRVIVEEEEFGRFQSFRFDSVVQEGLNKTAASVQGNKNGNFYHNAEN
jgi:hypothetical protein